MGPMEGGMLVVWIVLELAVAIGVGLCFWRTRIWGFLLLGGVLVVGPWAGTGLQLLCRHFVDQVSRGQRPWLFPFSLMGQEVSTGEFLSWMLLGMGLLKTALIAASLFLIARSFRRARRGMPVVRPKES